MNQRVADGAVGDVEVWVFLLKVIPDLPHKERAAFLSIQVLAVRWRWCSFPLATFAVCQAARQSRLAARVLAAARTTGTLKMTPRRAPGVLGLDFAGCTK